MLLLMGDFSMNRIISGDCIETMQSLPEASVDMVFADPPYNLQLEGELHRPNNSRVDGFEEAWDRFDGFASFDRFSQAWLSSSRRILRPDGAPWGIGSHHTTSPWYARLRDSGFGNLTD